jgi:exopolyphosphatase/guanosine-5'-triphosphate,3'-diphosphate pyrophosphatase
VLLTVAEQAGNAWRVLHETSAVTALGADARETGMIGEESAQRTLEAIEGAVREAVAMAADVRAYGTMALRIAANAGDFLAAASAQGTPVEVISGETEAELGLASVSEDPLFANRNPTVVDVGGHSTEFSGSDFRRSFPAGTLGLRTKPLSDESPSPGAVLKASAILDDLLEELPSAEGIIVGLGASVTNLASIRAELLEWSPEAVHGSTLTYEEVSRFVGRTMRMTDKERAAMTGIEPGRERTIHIGALIVERALLALRAEEIYVSVKGWRHAMLTRWL